MAAARLTPQLTAKLCGYFERGHTIEGGAGLVGIHKTTFHRWMRRGEDARAVLEEGLDVTAEDRRYARFVDAVELARAHGEGWLHERALEAMANPKDFGRWQGYVTLLERTRPDRWRRRASSEYAEPHGAKPARQLDVTKLDRAERAQLRELLAKAREDGD